MNKRPDPSAARILKAVLGWAKARQDVRGVALVGSHARGTTQSDSDIDVVVLVTAPAVFRGDSSWVDTIEWSLAGGRVATWSDEDYGVVWSRRVRLASGPEVEISFAPLSWADITPVDIGTRRVVSDGCRVLYDPDGSLDRLCTAVAV
ncbi:MAG: nucleotidyltransferase domain-containing protein [Stellaceae bacterium]